MGCGGAKESEEPAQAAAPPASPPASGDDRKEQASPPASGDDRKEQVEVDHELEDNKYLLLGVPLFKRLEQSDLEDLAKKCESVVFKKGQHIVRQGDDACYCMVIKDGDATATVEGSNNRGTLMKGSYWGEGFLYQKETDVEKKDVDTSRKVGETATAYEERMEKLRGKRRDVDTSPKAAQTVMAEMDMSLLKITREVFSPFAEKLKRIDEPHHKSR